MTEAEYREVKLKLQADLMRDMNELAENKKKIESLSTATHKTSDGELLWVDADGYIYASKPNNGSKRYFVCEDEATEDDEASCGTSIVEALTHISEIGNLVPF